MTLSDRSEIMQAIREFWLENKHPPSLWDLVAVTDRKKTAIYHHTQMLRKEGKLLPVRLLVPSDIQISFRGTDQNV
jgi:hypothetical protein